MPNMIVISSPVVIEPRYVTKVINKATIEIFIDLNKLECDKEHDTPVINKNPPEKKFTKYSI